MPINLLNLFRRHTNGENVRENDERDERDEELDDGLDEEELEEEEYEEYEEDEEVEDEEETNEDENSSSVSEASQEEITSTSEVTQGEIEEANMIPMIPSPEWLEKNGWEFVDFRIPRNGEIFINAHLKLSAENVNIGEQWGKRRWIIRPKMANQLAVEDKSIVEKTEEPAMPPVPDVQL